MNAVDPVMAAWVGAELFVKAKVPSLIEQKEIVGRQKTGMYIHPLAPRRISSHFHSTISPDLETEGTGRIQPGYRNGSESDKIAAIQNS
jgi:hypothetical protein